MRLRCWANRIRSRHWWRTQRCTTNYTQYGSDYGADKKRYGEFWEDVERFARNSPHTFAANFNTPTLVIHGQLDRRVPVNHGLELFNVLQNRGVPSKLVYFPDENHWILKPQNSLFWYETSRTVAGKICARSGRRQRGVGGAGRGDSKQGVTMSRSIDVKHC